MRIFILNKKRIDVLNLPTKVEGSFWITDLDDEDNKIANIESNNNHWFIKSNDLFQVFEKNISKDFLELTPNCFYELRNHETRKMIYTIPDFDRSFILYQCKHNKELTIGNKSNNTIAYLHLLLKHTIELTNINNQWSLNTEKDNLIYVNKIKISNNKTLLRNGDEIFIYGLRIVLFNNYLFINNPNNLVRIDYSILFPVRYAINKLPYEEIKEQDLYRDEDYYVKAPRVRRFINTYEITVAPPPKKEKLDEMPMIFLLGPMITMGMTSSVSLLNVLIRLSNGTATMENSWPTIVISIAMLTTTLLWPNLSKRWQKKQRIKKEKERQEKYQQYLDQKSRLLDLEMIRQSQILQENLLTTKECAQIIMQHQRILWERKISQKDFLTVRVGIGDVPLDTEINFNEDEFVLEEDNLKEMASHVVNRSKLLKQMPVSYSFFNKNVTAIMGQEGKLNSFVNNILLQLMTYHGYDDLKIIVFTNKQNENHWDYLKVLPHCFSNDKSLRFFAIEEDEIATINEYLIQEFVNRITEERNEIEKVEKEQDSKDSSQEMTFLPYYLILTDDFPKIRKLGIIQALLKNKRNYGFSLVVRETRLRRIPSECESFININNENSAILSINPTDNKEQGFACEIDDDTYMMECAKTLANIPIEFEFDNRNLPNSIGFLEMYKVGKIEQLNILNRWRLNDVTKTLRAMIGVNELNDPIYLDLHEKKHGPHGLIAGTTGSGKSEFIITYILSLALNYSPNEVAFILIDYKGGGLAGAFENARNNIRLPHLAGTITNLDKNELNRTLVSIDSELKKRQQKFNQAREILGESTMDIYKYQKFFRDGKLEEAIPHLFIICDEFAELKAQQPEFMDNLISTSRIGRSLGVHLILATQKPSGVVNDQIWSNSKFKVCLKVQDVSDSNEIIKKPDAATIKNAGRFYLQVGYDEVFLLGQSGYCGTPYIPKELAKQEIDRSIDFVDRVLNPFKNIVCETNKKTVENIGDELSNILKYITALSQRENINVKRLWYENIPEKIYLEDIMNKYHVQKKMNTVEAIIGEYDDPTNQRQDILKLTLNENGNTIVYGMSGVGREMLIKSIIFSTSLLYSTEEINFYVFDFGSESLRVFENFPHVADIVYQNEEEKVNKFFQLINEEMEYRKKLFADYNGEYKTYCQMNQKKLPMICFIINNYDAFKETFLNVEEDIIRITRDGKRFGIIMILTASSPSGLFSRLIRNFNHTFVMDMNDKNDYINILGKIGSVLPPSFEGRGLFKDEIAYEFQTAQICEKENSINFIKNIAISLKGKNTYIPKRIPIVPEIISVESLKDMINSLESIPIGIEKDKLNIATYNMKENKANLLLANDLESLKQPTILIAEIMSKIKNNATIIIDPEEKLNEAKSYCSGYSSKNITNFMDSLNKYIDEIVLKKQINLMIIIYGLDKMINSLENKIWTDFINKISKIEQINMVYVESVYKIKKFTFEPWYTSTINNVNGIWVGPGLLEQGSIKIADVDRKYKEKISNEYAWIFKNSTGRLIKLVNKGALDEE